MAYQSYLAIAYSPASDRRIDGQSYGTAAEAFKWYTANKTRDSYSNAWFKGRFDRQHTIQVDLVGGEKLKAAFERGGMTDDPMVVKLSSGPDGDTSWALKPFIPSSQVSYDYNNQSYRNFNKIKFDMSLAVQDDIVIANPPSYVSNSGASRVFASYANNAEFVLGNGNDVVAGGYGSDWFGAPQWVSGSKVIVGGSQSDTIYGSKDGDFLVGDRHARQEAPNWQRNPQEKPQEIVGANSSASFATQAALIEAITKEDVLEPGGFYKKTILRSSDGYTYARTMTDKNVFLNGPSGLSLRYLNTWQPRGDFISGGDGDDVVFGDDSSWSGEDLIEYKKNFEDTTEVITPAKNWRNYLDSTYQFMNWDAKAKQYVIPQWSNKSMPGERLRLGNDELHGGAGNDVIYGGFGSDLITGGPGFDQIHAPLQNLVPDFDPLWNGASVLYGGDMFRPDGVTLLKPDEINTSRFGYVDSPASRIYSQWRAGLTPKPDLFIVSAPLWTQAQLESYSSNPFNELKAVAESKKLNDNRSLLADTRVVDTALEVIGLIPVVGNVISASLSILRTWLEGPVKEPAPPSISGAADKTIVVNDFDIWDTIIFQDSKESAGLDLRTKITQASALSDDAAFAKYGSKGYVVMQRDEESDVFKTKSGSGEVETILRGFSFKKATEHFIESLIQDFGAHPNDPKYASIELKSAIGVQGKASFKNQGEKANLIDFFKAMSDKWGETHYYSSALQQGNEQSSGLFVEAIGHNILSPATIDALETSGFNAFYNAMENPVIPLSTSLA